MNSLQKIFFWSLLAKLAIAACVPLFPDEAYYWVWSHHPQWSYFDHPPVVAWLFWLGQPFEKLGGLVRWPAICFAHMTGILYVLTFKRYMSPQQLMWWALLFALQPLTGPGSIVITPDLPLMFFWALSFYLLDTLIETKKAPYALLLGAALGLGFSSKYVMVLFFPFALATLIFRRVRVQDILRWTVLLVPGLVIATFPVWLWNSQNDWASIRFQLHHGLGRESHWEPEWTLSYIGGQLLLIFPTVLFAMFRGSKAPTFRRANWLWVFAWGPILFFALTSFKSRTELNWPIVAFPVLLGLAVLPSQSFRWARLTVGIWSVALVLVLSDLVFGWAPFPDLKTREPHIYHELARAMGEIADPVYGRSYQMAASLSFELHRQIYKLAGMNRRDFYDFRPESRPLSQSHFYVVTEPGENLPEPWSHAILSRRPLIPHYELVEVQSP